MIKGFRDFILRGNVIDLAVAVIIGAAFKTVVDKFVAGVVNPLLGQLVGKPNFDEAFIVSHMKFGLVLTALLNFVLTALVIYLFLVVPANKYKKMNEKPKEDAEPPAEEKLLTEIRDLLKQGR